MRPIGKNPGPQVSDRQEDDGEDGGSRLIWSRRGLIIGAAVASAAAAATALISDAAPAAGKARTWWSAPSPPTLRPRRAWPTPPVPETPAALVSKDGRHRYDRRHQSRAVPGTDRRHDDQQPVHEPDDEDGGGGQREDDVPDRVRTPPPRANSGDGLVVHRPGEQRHRNGAPDPEGEHGAGGGFQPQSSPFGPGGDRVGVQPGPDCRYGQVERDAPPTAAVSRHGGQFVAVTVAEALGVNRTR